jgi:hypothetical protein
MLLPQLVAHVDTIRSASMPKSSWFWRGSIELFAEAQEKIDFSGHH